MMNNINDFFEKLEEPNQSVFLFLKKLILNYHQDIDLHLKWGLPFFYFKNKPLCYIWKDKKTDEPYLSFAKGSKIEHPSLIQGNRKLFKILPINANKDIDVDLITKILEEATKLY